MDNSETIAAKASGSGGAISLIRLSGERAIQICDSIFEAKSKTTSSSEVASTYSAQTTFEEEGGFTHAKIDRTSSSGITTNGIFSEIRSKVEKKLASQKGFTLHYGLIKSENKIVDDVLVSLFRAPHSYTGEDMVEISCHASPYIEQEILRLCAEAGARTAQRGEFTLRAFMNGKMELSQAEAVADVIASDSRASHALASRQMRGGYSHEFAGLRDKLLELLSLLELELDFSEEDVEFADRKRILDIVTSIELKIDKLASSFRLGNILKNGVPVAIVGSPNVGKSTLLNALLNEEKAMVSDIAGTTRDTVEDTINLSGVCFRFIDTAGIRDTSDRLENMGIERTFRKIETASVVLIVVDATSFDVASLKEVDKIISMQDPSQSVYYAIVVNKIDKLADSHAEKLVKELEVYFSLPVFKISARERVNIEYLIDFLLSSIGESADASVGGSVCESADVFSCESVGNSVGESSSVFTSEYTFGSVDKDIESTDIDCNTVNSSVVGNSLLSHSNNFIRADRTMISVNSNDLLSDSDNPIRVDRKMINTNGRRIIDSEEIIVFNSRHHEALMSAQSALLRAKEALASGVSGDLLSQDLREVLYHLGLITGDITTDDILGAIFSKFCIGK